MKWFFVCLFIFYVGFANTLEPKVVDRAVFHEGASWTWSYSEFNEESQQWERPYLYETYKVSERLENEVTIEMSSSESLEVTREPHHKFIVNLDKCFGVGESVRKLLGLKVAFYTKNSNGEWELLSKSHKGLAFTEKFNCLSGGLETESDKVTIEGLTYPVFQWVGAGNIKSWYSNLDLEHGGVALKRRSRNYKMTLVAP